MRKSVEPPPPARHAPMKTYATPPGERSRDSEATDLAACVLGHEEPQGATMDLVRYASIAIVALALYGLWILLLELL